jgi:hypothetical protein
MKMEMRVQHRLMPRMEKRRITLPSFIKTASVGKERQLQLPLSPGSGERHLRLQLERLLPLLHQPQKRNALPRRGRDNQLKGKRRLLQRLQRRSTGMNALLRDVKNELRKEECAKDMEQRPSNAQLRGVRTRFRKEKCVGGMGLMKRPNHAAVKDVRTLFRKEECAGGMEQR